MTELKDMIGNSWYTELEPEFNKPYFKQVKVVIVGQDPYHGPKQAHGLCFSVPNGVKLPPSLVNIYKELANDIPGFKIPSHGTLNSWAEQGVLLLNACLTVGVSQANSHSGKGWEKFTDSVIDWINKNTTGVVFMLWGKYAQKKGAHINTKNHCILKSVHPSPLSAHRGFFGCKHFSRCNEYLLQHGKTPIDWTHLPILKLSLFVDQERNKGTVYPPSHQVYSRTKFLPIDQVKVGKQDPYHGPKQAHVFLDPNYDSKIVEVQKCRQVNGDQMYEKYKKSASDTKKLGDIYQMKSNPRGYCVVINNEKFEELSDRLGSQHDVESLKKLFTQLHFLFEDHHDKTAQEINELVKHYKDMDHSNYDCFVLVILSHGSHDNFCGVDGEDVVINDMVSKFNSKSCESLCGKPKLFFIQACQGKLYDQGTKKAMTEEDQKEMKEITDKMNELDLAPSAEQADAVPSAEQADATFSNTGRADILIAMSTSPGFVSWRDPKKGTWFIQAVVDAFKNLAHSQDLNNIMTKVNDIVQKAETKLERHKQCPEYRSSLGKSLYFFPGLAQPNVPQPPQENKHLPSN